MKSDYPLPWCEALDMPYWKINLVFCYSENWLEYQKGKAMSEIIPEIDRIIESSNRYRDQQTN
jgi:hypothetical protein